MQAKGLILTLSLVEFAEHASDRLGDATDLGTTANKQPENDPVMAGIPSSLVRDMKRSPLDAPDARSAMVANPQCCSVLLAMVSCRARPALRYLPSPVMECSR